jgi:hypothetical protein
MSSHQKWELLERRMAKIERHNRFLLVGLAVAGLIVASLLTTAAANPSRTVEAQRFVLTSEDGQVRAELATLDGQYPRLTLKSPDGTKSTELSPLGVSVIDGSLSGKLPLIHLGNTGLYLTDKRGKVILELGGASVSGPQLAPVAEIKMFDEQGALIWHAP